MALQPDGKVLLAGDFTAINSTTRHRIARVDANGTLDSSFNPGANSSVNSVALQPDGKVLLAGDFTAINSTTRHRIARVDANGTLDTSFNPSANSSVNSVALQPDGKVLLGGRFTDINGTGRNRFARLSLPEAAIQSLTSENDHTRLQWLRSGAGPEVNLVNFSWSHNPDAPDEAWTKLGDENKIDRGVTRIPGGWELTGIQLPVSAARPLWVRAQGTATGGQNNASSYPLQSVRMLQLPKAQPTLAIGSSPNTSTLGAAVTLTATLSNAASPTGTVVFKSGTNTLCNEPVSGLNAICTSTNLGLGSHSITATYIGDDSNNSATSSPVTHLVSGYQQSPLPLPSTGGANSPGNVLVTIGSPAGCTAANAAFSASVPAGAPAGSRAPLGVFSFDASSTTTGACNGATLRVTLTYPAGSLAGLQPYKFGPARTGATDTWFRHGSITGDTVTYIVTDNGVGDRNPTVGAISDPFAPLALATAGSTVAIPTLSEWGMLLLSLLALGMGALHLRRRELAVH